MEDDQLMPKTAVSMAPASYEKRVFSAAGKVFVPIVMSECKYY